MKFKTPSGCEYAPYLLDMIQGNHTLIAGTTGAGKSVLENSIIYALLATHFPGNTKGNDGARFVLLDPKKVELQMYRKLPHTWLYADDIDGIVSALLQVRRLIDDRLKVMKRKGYRKTTDCPVYVFIDEMYDLIASKRGGEIVRIISDCASISRACSVFFVVLTQSPSRKVIPAQFKLLFNCRCGLRCNNAIESRQIIDDETAAELPRHGLGIVIKDLDRYKIKIPMYSDAEIESIVKFWTRQHPIWTYFRHKHNQI